MSTFAPAPSGGTGGRIGREVDDWVNRLNQHTEETARAMQAAYAVVLKELEPRLLALEAMIKERRDSGEPFSPSWLFRQERYQELIRQTRLLVGQYGAFTGGVVSQSQQAAIQAAYVEAARQIRQAGPPGTAESSFGFAAIPQTNIARLMGAMQESTPLGQLLNGFGVDAAQAIKTSIVRDNALGLGIDQMVRNLRNVANIPRIRAQRIVRTETLRAANEGLRDAYAASGVVKRWRWSAALSARTCAACLSLHGRTFPLTQPMQRHVQCRCSMVPVLAGESDDPTNEGSLWLRQQPLSVKQAVLGKEAGFAYHNKFVSLSEFLTFRQSPSWGRSAQVRPWSEVQKSMPKASGWQSFKAANIPPKPVAKVKPPQAFTTEAGMFGYPDAPASAPLARGAPSGVRLGDRPWGGDAMDHAGQANAIKQFRHALPKDPHERLTELNEQMEYVFRRNWLDSESEAIEAYFGDSYTTMNRAMRGKIVIGADHPLAAYSHDLERAMDERSMVNDEPMMVYRRIGGTSVRGDELQAGDTFVDFGFISTSANPHNASPFSGGVTMSIYVPPGAKFVPANGKTRYDFEAEILLPRGTPILIREVEHHRNGVHVYGEVLLEGTGND